MIELKPIFEIIKGSLELFGSYSKGTKEKKNKLYKEYLEPIFTEINLLHKNYLESFAKYRITLKTCQSKFDISHPIFAEIETDSILSSDLRERLYSIYDNENRKALQPLMGSFLSYIRAYFETFSSETNLEPISHYLEPNVPRRGLYLDLKYIVTKINRTESEKQKLSIQVLERRLEHMIRSYRRLVDNYETIKRELI